jgi:hypothetical protein
MGLVLGQHQDTADTGMQAVGQGEIDNPVLAAERHRRFGAVRRQGVEARPDAASQNNCECFFQHTLIDA